MPIQALPRVLSAAELFTFPSDGNRYELYQGVVWMMSPAGGRHGRLANHLAWLLSNHVKQHGLGIVFAAETGFRIATDPDSVLAPDVAFVSKARMVGLEEETGYLPLAPDLAIEVLSPNDRFTRVETKSLAWLDAGCKLVLLVDPESQTIHVYHSRRQIEIFRTGETIDCHHAVPDWILPVATVFE